APAPSRPFTPSAWVSAERLIGGMSLVAAGGGAGGADAEGRLPPPPPATGWLGRAPTTGAAAAARAKLSPKLIVTPSAMPRMRPRLMKADTLASGTPMTRWVPQPGQRRTPIARGREHFGHSKTVWLIS